MGYFARRACSISREKPRSSPGPDRELARPSRGSSRGRAPPSGWPIATPKRRHADCRRDHPGRRTGHRLHLRRLGCRLGRGALSRNRGGASTPRHPRQQCRHRPCRRDRADDPRGSRPRLPRQRRRRLPLRPRRGGGHAPPGERRHPQHVLDRRAGRDPGPLRVFDDQGRRPDHDAVDRRRLREAGHPLQLHLPGAGPHTVRRRLSRQELSRPGGRNVENTLRVPADRPHGAARRHRRPGALPLLRRSVVRHRLGLPDRRRGHRPMKLARFGTPGAETPGVITDDGTRIDASGFVRDYDEAFFGGDGIRALGAWVTDNGAAAPRLPRDARLGPPLVRPSKIVCIGLNFRDHAAESNMELPERAGHVLQGDHRARCGPDDPVMIPRGGDEARLGSGAGRRDRQEGVLRRRGARARTCRRLRACTTTTPSAPSSSSAAGSGSRARAPTPSRRSVRSSRRATKLPIRTRSACG